MKEVSKDGVVYFASGSIPEQGAAHAFFSRNGGVSPEPFATLNFAVKVGDTPENVGENRARVARALGLPLKETVTARQVHGSEVAIVEAGVAFDPAVEADAVLTGVSGVPVGVLTADCLPVLLYDPVKKAVGAVHAGWRGTVLGVAASAVRTLRTNFGSEPGDIRAVFGPRIGPCCYSVKMDVYREFESAFGAKAKGFFRNNGGLKCDLSEANRSLLLDTGLAPGNVDTEAPCTACDTEMFFSYRKEVCGGRLTNVETSVETNDTGRLLSFIMLR